MDIAPLPIGFYARSTIDVARELIGCHLVRRVGGRLLVGLIVETEAYLPRGDSASHGYRGRTNSNASMFGRPGLSYVYPIHAKWCFNVVTDREGVPAAVLIRGIEPSLGIAAMIRNRGLTTAGGVIASGPARLCQALLIDRSFDGWDLTVGRRLWIQSGDKDRGSFRTIRTPRIGVTSAQHRRLRFVRVANG